MPWKSTLNFIKDLAILLRNQFPDALGLRIRNVNQAAKYFEINFRTNEASREVVLTKVFSDNRKKAIVSRIFPKDITIVRVSVKNLPYEGEIILKEQMSSIFGDYGESWKWAFSIRSMDIFLLFENLSP